MNTIEAITQYKLVAIVRRVAPKDILATAKALYEGGIRLLEVTFDQASPDCVADVVESLERLKPMRDLGMRIGTGTTLTIEQVEAAKQAEAEFVLAPDTNIEVIKSHQEIGYGCDSGSLHSIGDHERMERWSRYREAISRRQFGYSLLQGDQRPHQPCAVDGCWWSG